MSALLCDVPTPALLLDRARLRANAARMRAVAARHGVRLRPHFKTAKCVEVMEEALGYPYRALTVATLDEAEWLVARRYTDLLYAVGVVPDKIGRVAAIGWRGARLDVLVDDPDNAAAVAARAEAEASPLRVWIEVDSGQHRGGRAPDDPALVETARVLARHRFTGLAGVLTHAGHSYAARGPAELARVAEEERAAAVRAADAIRAAGVPCPEVSVGSTPTALFAAHLEGVTELRAGVYLFFDRVQLAIGACGPDELALSVLATVVSRRDDAAWIDAGTLALSAEPHPDGLGFGEVVALDGGPLPGAPRVDALNQEHGRVVASAGRLEGLAVGERVRVFPNHACITAACFDRYHVLEGERAETSWARLRG